MANPGAHGRRRPASAPLELFFDLVFVFALTQMTDLMAEDPTMIHVVRGVLVIGVLWWCWTGYAWPGNIVRADEDVIRGQRRDGAAWAARAGTLISPGPLDHSPSGVMIQAAM